jgi:hypothetical protein
MYGKSEACCTQFRDCPSGSRPRPIHTKRFPRGIPFWKARIMTFGERFVKERAWLKTDHFAVTYSLRAKLEASALPDWERERYAYIQNKVLVTADEGTGASISRRYWQGKCGGRYTKYIEELDEWGQLEVNPSYWATGDEATAFSKSYRVPESALTGGICTLSFRRKRFHPPQPVNDATDEVSRYALKCLSFLDVVKDDRFWLPEDPIRRSRIKSHCEHIAFKDFGLGYGGECRRLFHRVVMMPSEGRRNLKHYCQPLIEYDVKTCHPVLLLPLFTDAGERQRYQDLIAADIYTEIGRAMGVADREKVKTDFVRVVNPKWRDLEWLGERYVFRYFRERFPRFTNDVLSIRTDLALSLQNFEADLMVQRLGMYCRSEGLFWIPQHDGWISTLSDGEIIRGHARKLVSDAVGFTPSVPGQVLD